MQKYGGMYHDLDYEIIDAEAAVQLMKNFDFVNAKEFPWWDASIGNALFLAKPDHPIINELSRIIKRNLNKEPDMPLYIAMPKNEVSRVLFKTGPIAMSIPCIKKRTDETLIAPSHMFYNFDYVRTPDYVRGYIKDAVLTRNFEGFEGLPIKTVGGDMFEAGWAQAPDYIKQIRYLDGKVIKTSQTQLTLRGSTSAPHPPTQNTFGNLALAITGGTLLCSIGIAAQSIYTRVFGAEASKEQITQAKDLLSEVDKFDLKELNKLYQENKDNYDKLLSEVNRLYDLKMHNSKKYSDLREKLYEITDDKNAARDLPERIIELKQNQEILNKPNVKEGEIENLTKEYEDIQKIYNKLNLKKEKDRSSSKFIDKIKRSERSSHQL